MRNHSLRLALGASLAAIAFAGFSAPAFAQDEGASTDEGGLNTIIVTVNRREENLQDVPVSVDTLGAATVQSIFDSGDTTTALAARSPGLYVESSNGRVAPRFYIRGLGNTDFDLAASQPVSVVMDDVVMENVTLKSFPLFDVDNIEIFRGPQGTLFGRNTTAGIVKIDTAKPTEEFSARGSISVGSHATVAVDAGVGGAIVPGLLSTRISVLLQRRSDYIDNAFTGEDNEYGGYRDLAGRAQFLFDSGGPLTVLLAGQYRDLNGEAPLFRANILGPGNKLNGNYDRDEVYFDGGGGNPAKYKIWGLSGKIEYDMGGVTLTSITAYNESHGSSRGDIDGGVAGDGPGFIPFSSDTTDSIDLHQTTQEVRLASNGDGPISWQVGGFYFDSGFFVNTVGDGFPPSTTVHHGNESWAVFGQVSGELTEGLKLTGGLRYTEDDKDFYVVGGNPADDRDVSDERLSWDISAMFEAAEDFSVYARVASGFRAPTIQGRDVAFFNPPSVATSEKIMSYEVGFKSELADRRVRLNGAAFHYVVTDPQFTAVGGGGNLVQLINADKGTAWGFEFDTEIQPSDNFLITAGISYNKTKIKDDTLAVGICAQCTVTDPIVVINATNRALVNGNPFPNAPDWIGDITARYSIPVGGDHEIFIFTDWTYQGDTNLFLYESEEFHTGGQIEGGLRIGYGAQDGSWEVAAFARNITNEDNIKGGIDFNNNTAFVNDPRIIGLSGRFKF